MTIYKPILDKIKSMKPDPRVKAHTDMILAGMERYPRKQGEGWNKWYRRVEIMLEIEDEIAAPIIVKPYEMIDTTYDEDAF